MMERRRKSVSDLPETDPETGASSSSMLERLRSPLLDRRALRSTSTSSGASTTSESLVHLPKPHSHSHSRSRSSKPPLRPSIVEKQQQQAPSSISRSKSAPSPPSISRSRSAPFHHRTASGGGGGTGPPRDHALFRSSGRSSPQYRANSAVVRFDERLLPVRTNYGIAGYNTSRSRRGESRGRQGVVLRTRSRNVRVVGLGLWTRRVLVRVMRTRVRSACSRLLMRFRRPRGR